MLVNETFVKNIGLDPSKAMGTKLTDGQSRVWEIAGVMKDFNFGTLHKKLEPFMVWINHKEDGYWSNLTVHTTTKIIKNCWEK